MKWTTSDLKKNWGLSIFVFSVFVSMLVLAIKPVGLHYQLYTAVSPYFWNLQDPYGLPGIVSANINPPPTGMFFYSMFAWLPNGLGQWLYVALCVVILLGGMLRFLTILDKKGLGLDQKGLGNVLQGPWGQLVWLMFSSEIVGSIGATKSDLLVLGTVFYAAGSVLENKRVWLYFFLLGSALSIKLQPVATVLLLGLADVFLYRRIKAMGALFLGFALWNLLPFAFFPADFVVRVFKHWAEYLNWYATPNYCDRIFQQIFRWYGVWIGPFPSYRIANWITLGVGSSVGLLYCSLFLRFNEKKEADRVLAVLAALGTGAGFSVLFAPLMQSNSYVVYTPLALALFSLWRLGIASDWVTKLSLPLIYFFVSIVYSDLVPQVLRLWCYEHATKPMAVAVGWVFLITTLVLHLKVEPSLRKTRKVIFAQAT